MKHLYKFSLIIVAIATYTFITFGVDRSTGSPGGKTGSPGDNGATCTDCHSGEATPQDDLISSDIPNNGFIPGETYTITAEITDDAAELLGFELTAEDNAGNKMGDFTITNETETQFTNGDKAVTHTSDGIEPSGNSNSWSFEWTAPDQPDSEVTFYAAFNAANGNGATTGDNIYTSEMTAAIDDVGIDEEESIAKMYPNPATDFLKVEFKQSTARQLEIINTRGAVVETVQTDERKITIPLQGLKKGIYFLKEDNTSLKRFVVL
ncbi:MAG: T9SS type A sorting domain-containing protein [Bacteroidales bacterium]|nr:T9SS type A sorting domain-containing protein [Bacteroidales bacterium]MCF8332813.1 T9SS type A sorting domain-containing protein [Bacteroidales bacterium]